MLEEFRMQTAVHNGLRMKVHLSGSCGSIFPDDQLPVLELLNRVKRFPVLTPKMGKMFVTDEDLLEVRHLVWLGELANDAFDAHQAKPVHKSRRKEKG